MATTIVGLFDDRDTAETAVMDLIAAGFDRRRVSVLAADPRGELYRSHIREDGNLSGEGAATGLTSGAVVGGLLGLLIGAGLIFVPAGVIAAGPIAGLIAGGAAGAATGGILGGLIGLGIPESEADVYAESVRRGGTIVTIEADESRADEAHRILDRDGAVNVEDRAESYRQEGFSSYDSEAPVLTDEEIARERERNALTTGAIDEATAARVRRYTQGSPGTGSGAYADNPPRDVDYMDHTPTGVPNNQPGIQTGGHDLDGTPDTRGVTEKIADALTGDKYDDKTGKRID
ncbi:hypothetical protein [Fimbriimonas ginsengisoli]|uniref:General stress protein 17M-like domain-containing protein n=1 Tax=Fimbriimonas ginsengisoli Gsoil 348 TaxID=661478 RepID=A0A068NKM4_FIMGI|nr:hypothetical protein [Fimbriimonas ginsengisoli]AIE84108.1 hypothetical protein OP10G_0740 [Fimbriimonas ginsengisoli Gsoil 348]